MLDASTPHVCRFDFVRGYGGQFVREYVLATEPHFVVGEYWDSLDYDGSVPRINQNRHRQQTIDWITAAGGAATAFDVTTKGILHAVFEVRVFATTCYHTLCMGDVLQLPLLYVEYKDSNSKAGMVQTSVSSCNVSSPLLLSQSTRLIMFEHKLDSGSVQVQLVLPHAAGPVQD